MVRKQARKTVGSSRSKPSASPGARIKKIQTYEDTLSEGGVDDCAC